MLNSLLLFGIWYIMICNVWGTHFGDFASLNGVTNTNNLIIFLLKGAVFSVPFVVIFWFKRQGAKLKKQQKAMILEDAFALVDEHIATLIIQRNTKIKYDVYGNADLKLWLKEINYFIDTVLRPNIKDIIRIEHELLMSIENKVFTHIQKKTSTYQYVAVDGHAFEKECLEAFKLQGWGGYKTKGSGDQGADLILTYEDISVVVQCKLYSVKVSNSAVQEVYAAKAIYGADYAVVITNNGYRPSAIEAAQKTGVFLLTTGMEAELLGLIIKNRASRKLQ